MFEKESPNHSEYHDNLFCHDWEATVEFMQNVTVPWIAFKVLAAGAIPPEERFRFAFESGADFICVGMFDFQVERNNRNDDQNGGAPVASALPGAAARLDWTPLMASPPAAIPWTLVPVAQYQTNSTHIFFPVAPTPGSKAFFRLRKQ